MEVTSQPHPQAEDTGSIQAKNTGDGVGNPEGVMPAAYEFVPVNRYADNEEGMEPLGDTGEVRGQGSNEATPII